MSIPGDRPNQQLPVPHGGDGHCGGIRRSLNEITSIQRAGAKQGHTCLSLCTADEAQIPSRFAGVPGPELAEEKRPNRKEHSRSKGFGPWRKTAIFVLIKRTISHTEELLFSTGERKTGPWSPGPEAPVALVPTTQNWACSLFAGQLVQRSLYLVTPRRRRMIRNSSHRSKRSSLHYPA